MTPLLQRVRGAGAEIRLSFLRVLNRIVCTLLGGLLLLNQAYPQAITQLGSGLPKWALIPAAIAFYSLVEFASARPKDAA